MTHADLLRDLTESYLKTLISEASGALTPDFDATAAFGELGINSFHVLKIVRALEADFGTLPKSLLFENFNINDLAGYFVTHHEPTLVARFGAELRGADGPTPEAARSAPSSTFVEPLASARRVVAASAEARPVLLPEQAARAHPELAELVQALFARYKLEGSVSRGTRKIAPNLFIGAARRGYFHYGRSRNLMLLYGYTGPRDYVPELVEEVHRHCVARGLRLNILADEPIPPIAGTSFSATPFGALQRIVDLRTFTLEGGAMRRLRYQVAKFEKSGACRTEEYRAGSHPETDRSIADVIERWCASRTMVNPLVHDVRDEILAGKLAVEHRLFLTYRDDALQNVILITPLCAELNGYLMDLEFYPPEMPMGGLEFAIVRMIERLAAEGCDVLSLGGTYGCKLDASASADPAVDKLLDDLRAQGTFNDEGNLQFKNKFRPETRPIFLCRPAGSDDPDSVIDIIMMIADPLRVQTSDEENQASVSSARAEVPRVEAHGTSRVASARAAAPAQVGAEGRAAALSAAGFNPLHLPREHVDVDLKTDSWAQLELPGIEAQMRRLHARLQQPASVDESLRAIFPFSRFVLTASGQAAEHVFFKAWPRKGVVPQNLLFPSTIFHQIDQGFTPLELPDPQVFRLTAAAPCKGHLDWEALQAQVARDPAAIALVCLELDDNAAGGAPVSLRHLADVKRLLAGHSIPLVLDATRVLENARFLIEHEQEHAGQALWAVARDTLSVADAVIGSLTKDFCVTRGGLIATSDLELFQACQRLVEDEGAGIDRIDRQMIALSLQGRAHIEAEVRRRMEAVRRLWQALRDHGVPVVAPAGGHCVLIDVKPLPEFQGFAEPVASFLAWLYLSTGIRAGAHSVGMQTRTPLNGVVRLAVPLGLADAAVELAIERLLAAFERKVNIPEVVTESRRPATLGGVDVTYRLVRYHEVVAGAAVAADSTAAARADGRDATPERAVDAGGAPRVSRLRAPRRVQDVAVIGMAGRYPKARTLRELWDNLAAGRDCVEEIPAVRHAARLRHGPAAKYRGGFIDDIDRFDSLFFNISPREAEMLDPQERLFLEVAWETLEDAGYYPEILVQEDAPRNIGVFVGAVWAMYQMLGVEEKHVGHDVVPNSFLWSIANRVSYCLNLSGPSLTVDTACSSSLTALYLACEAIHAGECAAAIVGGVNLDLHQAKLNINQQGGALSPDGVCRSFGRGANGYVAGEGVGALLLKPLDDALRDRDHVYGVIKSAVVNHGGRTSGYTVPNPKAQAEVIASALEKAGVDARTIGYVEAHGTGTELGDPIEVTGLSNAFRAHAVAERACALGSIKTNIGHLEAAAGVVSVSKVLLQMKHRRLAPSLHSAELNEHIDFEHSPFYVVQAPEDWTPRELDGVSLPLRAGVSSFGAGGSNAHVILESHEPAPRPREDVPEGRPLVFPLSAHAEEQLRQAALRLAEFLRLDDTDLCDVAYTLQRGRKSFAHRLAVVSRSRAELIEKLGAFVDGRRSADVVAGHVKSGEGVTRLLNRREKEEFLRLVSQARDPHKLAALWAEGLFADWQGVPSEGPGQRTSLPTYPFADRRHWACEPAAARPALRPVSGAHPLVDTNESTFERQLFKKTFHQGDFFIYDHHVSSIATLPGVAYLEFARKAGEMAAGRKVQRIRNILWVSPITVQGSVPQPVLIELKPSGDSVQFEVFSEDSAANKTLHSQGRLQYATRQEAEAQPEYVDLEALRARCTQAMEGRSAYPLFKSFGLDLGPSFQVLEQVFKNEDETLGVLRLPESRQGDLESLLLHPSLVDGSLQAGVAARLDADASDMFVPFSIGEVEILHPLPPVCLSYITAVKDERKERGDASRVVRSNVLILDETGKVLVRIRESTGIPLREVHKKPAADVDAEGFARLYYSYDWEPAPLPDAGAEAGVPGPMVLFDTGVARRDLYRARLTQAGARADAVVLVRPGEGFEDLGEQAYAIDPSNRDHFERLFKTLVERGCPLDTICFAWPLGDAGAHNDAGPNEGLERGVSAFLSLCQAVVKHKTEGGARLLYLYDTRPGEARPHHEAMSGFMNTLRLEHPKLAGKLLEIRADEVDDGLILDAVTAECRAPAPDATTVRHDGRDRLVKRLRAFELEDAADSPAARIRDNGVYLITGGAGGLGLLFAEFLAREHKARLVLTGRSKLSAEREAKLEQLRGAGAEVVYCVADVAKHEDVRRLIDDSRGRFGRIDGVIHAAGVLRDSLIRNKTPEELAAVCAPKVQGTLHLDELTRDAELDFFVTFSSLAAVAGNAGQCDYSFANHFMDAFAAERERRRARGERTGKTLSVNWSLWADGGMKLDAQTEAYFKKTLGIRPLRAAVGLDAFVRGLASPRCQFAVLEGVQDKVEVAWGLKKKVAPPAAAPAPAASRATSSAPNVVAADADLLAWLQDDLTRIVMRLLKLEASDVASDKILLDLGFDSIGLTTFANAVNERFELDITPVLFFDYPSIAEISRHLVAERSSELARVHRGAGGPASGAEPPASAPPPTAPANVDREPAPLVGIRKGWDPAALERDPVLASGGAGFPPELRFVRQPIAIVGMSGVMPQSEDLTEFWANLEGSRDMITLIPPDRWRWEDYYGDPLKEVNKSNSKWGGFMKEVDKFDPLFFGISPREAQAMDPQQRIFLETVWKAIEDSGQKVSDLSGTKTGLFVGVATNDYTDVMTTGRIELDGYTASGNSHSVLANRVSFLLNLHGPSAPIDTACSSSLVALHRAIESIHTGSCDMAIVGGVQVMLSPAAYISFGMAGMLSGDGQCKTFDQRANGYVRGEGCGAIFIKPLSAAEADGNHIYAVIRATAENHGGRVTTLTAPNSAAQTELLVEAYEKAHVDPATVGYIECHGTGTSLGDPIEVQSLSKAFAELYKRHRKEPPRTPHCGLSSVKTNIGHLETAAGIASVLKVLLAIRHKQIPANIHFETLNPYINLKGTPFYIADRLTPWEAPVSGDGAPLPRLAGVSSFGFGGANAHIVLEEYVPPSRPTVAQEPRLIVLSAKNAERLQAYARALRAYLEREDVELADLAYTLQVGRDEMPERLALVVSSRADLERQLDAVLDGEAPAGSHRNNVNTGSKAGAQAGGDVQAVVARKDLARLAELWACGATVAWRGLYGSDLPRRIAVPTYPFARERHWIRSSGGRAQPATAVAQLHPLVHRNTSTLEQQKFTSRFSGQEFYLADHVVDTQKILPGVAYLEMARVAGELSANARVRVIRNLTWERPLVVEGEAHDVEIALTPARSEVKFVVRTALAEGAVTHCTGRLAYGADASASEFLDIGAIRERCSQPVMSGPELYGFLNRAGLKLGASFQIVQSLWASHSESLAVLNLPEHLRGEAGLFGLHPALMDGSLHAAVGLMATNGIDVVLSLPYSVGEVQILHPLHDLRYACATWSEGHNPGQGLHKATFHLLDQDGKVLVRIKELVSRPLQNSASRLNLRVPEEPPLTLVSAPAGEARLQALIPVWSRVRAEADARAQGPKSPRLLLLGERASHLAWLRRACPDSASVVTSAAGSGLEAALAEGAFDQLVWIAPDIDDDAGGPDDACERVIERQDEGVLAVFRIITALLRLGFGNRKLQWTLVTGRTQPVASGEAIQPAHAAVAGLVGSLAKEYPHWDLRLVDLETLASVTARECLALPWDKQGNALAHRQGAWFRERLALATALPSPQDAYRQDGVYVVIGGAGGVGEEWTRYMIRNYRARVVWIGRRESDAAIETKIAALARLGPAPLYLRADATDAAALERARARILDVYPAIHGVVHSAIVLQDQGLARMEESVFRASLSAKVDVSVNIDRVFGAHDLDFLLFFSSIVSFVKSPGQSNYAAGCTFKDSFAHELRRRRGYPVKVINWGYWGDVGVVADESYKKLMAQMGVGSIEPAEGMASLQVLVGSELSQMALIKTLGNQATAGFDLSESVSYQAGAHPDVLPRVQQELASRPARDALTALASERPTPEMAALVTQILAASLASLGLFRDGRRTLADLPAAAAPAAYYERWLGRSIAHLEQHGVLDADGSLRQEVRTLADLWAEWEAQSSLWRAAPHLKAQSVFLEACLRALPAVVSGRQRATDVLFPNSSMHLVEGIYRGNAIADHFNDVLGETLVACIEQLRRADPRSGIRVIEIGAGTGGTTARLLPALQRLEIAEYCYTDVSRAFLMHAQKHFQPSLAALTTALFDVSRPPASQSIPAGQYDFAIAANVLHATADIRETLRNVKATLRKRGILLLNEISTWSLFNHLTFGLLEGWWLPEDSEVRLPGSPGLAPETWREVLAEEGFESIFFPARDAHELGQQIVVAASNGWVRQRIVKPVPAARPAAVERAAEPAEVGATHDERKPQSESSAERTEPMSHDYVRQVITQKLSEALRMDAAQIRGDAPFADYGVDSIIGVNFVRTVSEALQIELETTSLFEYSTVEQLAQHIVRNFQPRIAAQRRPTGATPAAPDARAAASQAALETRPERRFMVANRLAGVPDAEDAGGEDGTPALAIEPIAIIGMSGRFAQSDSLEAFWRNLAEGQDLVSKVSRWGASDCRMPGAAGASYCDSGSFIDSIDRFDAGFFGIPPEEALYMDPQQRLFLEEAWKALEDAGYAGKSVHEKTCGVYVGCGSSNYDYLFAEDAPPQAFWGNSEAVIPARIAYHLNLQGPAIAVDTACSSSLVAIHLACQGLWSGETEMALAGGVFLQATPGFYRVANRAGMLSPRGRCRSFDAQADGFVPGEGVGAVVLKSLRHALRDGDFIHGVIAGSGINQDGRSNGLIAPNGRAQERLERAVYRRFDIDPATIQVLEAHGTGTLLGDSIEYGAISRCFREAADRGQFCALGTVKTNIGHAATAAGIAGVLKLLLSLEHRQIPPSLHFEQANPAIDLKSGPFYVNTQLRAWAAPDAGARRAAVSAFGFSGTNAHLVIDEAPRLERALSTAPGYLVVLSARTAEQLRRQARNLAAFVEPSPDLSMNDLSFSLFVGRTHFAQRLACIARDPEDLRRRLEQWIATGEAPQLSTSPAEGVPARQHAAMTKAGNYCIRECRNAESAESYLENLAAVAELYVQGYPLDFGALFPAESRRMPLPTYPFADERYWVDAPAVQPSRPTIGAPARLHPLLHANTSTLRELSFSATFSSAEPFLEDHPLAAHGHPGERVLPAAACLEMARAAVEEAAALPPRSAVIELRQTVWGAALVVTGSTRVTVALVTGEDAGVAFEIYSGDAEAPVVHCQGRAVVNDPDPPTRLDVDELRACERPGARAGGRLVRVSLPASVAGGDAGQGFLIPPGVLSRVLQERAGRAVSLVPRALDSLRVLRPCPEELLAWTRAADGAPFAQEQASQRVDVDLMDLEGNVCVQVRGLSFDADEVAEGPAWIFSSELQSGAEPDEAHDASLAAEEKLILFLKQEAAIQLRRPLDEISTDVSYFDLGLSSLALANIVQNASRLLQEQLLPSVLFDYSDIRSLAAHLAATRRAQVDAVRVMRRARAAAPAARREGPPLMPLARNDFRAGRLAAPRDETPVVVRPESVLPDPVALASVLWEDGTPADSYEKLTF